LRGGRAGEQDCSQSEKGSHDQSLCRYGPLALNVRRGPRTLAAGGLSRK
jgi:hypothetical protein